MDLIIILYTYLMMIKEIRARTFDERRMVARALLKERKKNKTKKRKRKERVLRIFRKRSRGPYVTRVVSPPEPVGSGGGFFFFFFGFLISVFVNREESREY